MRLFASVVTQEEAAGSDRPVGVSVRILAIDTALDTCAACVMAEESEAPGCHPICGNTLGGRAVGQVCQC